MSQERKNKKNKQKKQKILFAVIACLSVVALVMVTVAVASVVSSKNVQRFDENVTDTSSVEEKTSYEIEKLSVPLDDLEVQINDIISDVQKQVGGDWSVYVTIPKTGDSMSINNKKLQAASVIKLFIMCTFYEDYDALKKEYKDVYDIDELMSDMIILSDNDAADALVRMIGHGDSIEKKKKINEFCKKYGFNDTNMDRLMREDNVVNDNFTTVEDTGKLLQMIYEGRFPHTSDMMNYMEHQDRKHKLPAGVPENVRTANKTGELEDCQNDACIVFTKYPYIIVVMVDDVYDYQIPIDAIADISTAAYNYIAPKL